MTFYARTAKAGFIWGLLGRGMNEIVSIPTTMILARLLSPHDFGVAAAAGFFVALSQRLTNFGFNTALVQVKELTEAHLSTVLVINAVLGVVLAAALSLAAPFLGTAFNSAETAAVLPVAALTFALGGLSAVPGALLNRNLKFREIVYVDWLYTFVGAIIGLALAWMGFGYWSIVWAQVAGTLAQTVARFWVAGWVPRFRFSTAICRELFSFGIGLHLKRLLEAGAQNIDNLIIGRVLGITMLGFYDKAFTTMTRAVVAVNTAGPAVSFRILAIIQDDRERFKQALRKLLMTGTLIAYPTLTGLIVVAPELFLTMFGQQWLPSVVPFQILCGAAIFKVLIAYLSTATQSKGWIWGEVWRQGVYLGLVVGAVSIGSRWGLPGAAWGILFATAVMTVLMMILLRVATGLPWGDQVSPQLPAVCCSLGLAISLLLLNHTFAETFAALPTLAALLVKSAVGALFVALFLWFARFRELRIVLIDTCYEFAPRLAKTLRLQV